MKRKDKKITKTSETYLKICWTCLILICPFLVTAIVGMGIENKLVCYTGLIGIASLVGVMLVLGIVAVIFLIWLS